MCIEQMLDDFLTQQDEATEDPCQYCPNYTPGCWEECSEWKERWKKEDQDDIPW